MAANLQPRLVKTYTNVFNGLKIYAAIHSVYKILPHCHRLRGMNGIRFIEHLNVLEDYNILDSPLSLCPGFY